ncbi:hypothetical protein AB0N65_11875 [Paenarthrobacter sp. NPDC089322]|uniref:hypothetical protein n=1 Tax=Paenarthrobacter sp. NPDC089322 TaxID=3155065 RepID=UPI0034422613
MKPHRRVIIGRNIALTSGAVLAFTRGLSYATINPESLNLGQSLVTFDGRILGLWAAVWFTAGILCIADMINRHTRHGLSLVVGAVAAWGVGYLFAWALTGFTNPDLATAAMIWLTPAGLVLGFLIKVTALQDMLRKQQEQSGGTSE